MHFHRNITKPLPHLISKCCTCTGQRGGGGGGEKDDDKNNDDNKDKAVGAITSHFGGK